jgi:heat shock protein HslJ
LLEAIFRHRAEGVKYRVKKEIPYMKRFLILTMFLGISMLLACAGTKSGDSGTRTGEMQITSQRIKDIAGIEWQLQNMKTDKHTVALIKDTKNTFSCDENGKVAGVATINRYFGSFRFKEDGSINWDKAFGMTRMAGPPELMEQETKFMQALPRTSRIYIKKEKLVLISTDQSTLLEFKKIK